MALYALTAPAKPYGSLKPEPIELSLNGNRRTHAKIFKLRFQKAIIVVFYDLVRSSGYKNTDM